MKDNEHKAIWNLNWELDKSKEDCYKFISTIDYFRHGKSRWHFHLGVFIPQTEAVQLLFPGLFYDALSAT